MGVQPKPAFLTSQYLYEWFRAFDLATITSGSTVPQLNKQDLSPLPIRVPSLDLQEEFGRRLEILSVQRASVQIASATNDELIASLQSRAFRGDL